MLLSDFDINDKFLAHTLKDEPSETLKEHSELTFEYYKKISKEKNLNHLIDNLIKTIDGENFEFIKKMFEGAILLHDLGKTNPYFQAKKMNNSLFSKYKDKSESSNHSFKSSDMYLDHLLPKIGEFNNRTQKERLKFIAYAFSYHMAKHHGQLSIFESYRDDENNVKSYQRHLDKLNIPHFEFYILNKLLFSILVSADYYATTEYMAKFPMKNFGLFSNKKLKELKTKFDNYINQFGEPTGINKLRNDIFKEAEKNLLQNLDKQIYYLEAPTGSGKTITSINLALQLLNKDNRLNKLFYIFPFNTLVEQTKSVFDDIFGDDLKIETINSISPIEIKDAQEDEESNYTKSYVNRLFFHSPAIITTHVSLFNILFGTSKEDNFPLWQLANSVIIIDEIQSYNNNLWWYMVEFFDKYAKLFNIKIIIMSATLPKLDYFLEKKDNFVDLISEEKREYFFTHNYFKERVTVDFSLLEEGQINLEQLEDFFDDKRVGYQKILFEFIKKQRAREFYNQIKEIYENVYELSGDDNKAYRQFVINKTKEDKPIIIVATQVIEAGVDIDMDLGFKDISTLDSEEQFMGRINRSCKKKNSKVYFFNMDEASKIYRGDNRLGFDLTKKKYRTVLSNKNYKDYYKDVLKVIQKNGLRFDSGVTTNIDKFTNMLQKLDYKEISKTMTLINSENFTLYFPFMLDISIYKGVKEFENIDKIYLTDGKLDGLKVWEIYLKLREIDGFAKMKVNSSYINSLMQFFTFNIIKFQGQNRPTIGEEIGGFYFVDDWESYIDEDGKFDRIEYQKKCESIFL